MGAIDTMYAQCDQYVVPDNIMIRYFTVLFY